MLMGETRHVKALESRSQLLDAALASADEANRRWEECRALVDQLRMENAALRATLSQSQMANQNQNQNQGHGGGSPVQQGQNQGQTEEKREGAAATVKE